MFGNQLSSTLLQLITQAEKHNHTRVWERRGGGHAGKVITFTFVYLVTANVWRFLQHEDQLLLLKCVAIYHISIPFVKSLLQMPGRQSKSKKEWRLMSIVQIHLQCPHSWILTSAVVLLRCLCRYCHCSIIEPFSNETWLKIIIWVQQKKKKTLPEKVGETQKLLNIN